MATFWERAACSFGLPYVLFVFCLNIPPAYEVYRGYIVFAFSVTMFVCLSVCL